MTSATQQPPIEDPEMEEAVATLWADLDGVISIVMGLVDLISDREALRRVDPAKLREVTAAKLREVIERRNAVLTPLGIDAEEA